MDISSRIKDLRKKHGLNQFELAEEIGISVDTVRRWESDKQVPRADELSKLATVLEVSINELLNGPDTQKWELRLVMRKAGDPQEGVIDIGQNRLYRYCREKKLLCSRKGRQYNKPTQYAIERGLFNLQVSGGFYAVTMITPQSNV